MRWMPMFAGTVTLSEATKPLKLLMGGDVVEWHVIDNGRWGRHRYHNRVLWR